MQCKIVRSTKIYYSYIGMHIASLCVVQSRTEREQRNMEYIIATWSRAKGKWNKQTSIPQEDEGRWVKKGHIMIETVFSAYGREAEEDYVFKFYSKKLGTELIEGTIVDKRSIWKPEENPTLGLEHERYRKVQYLVKIRTTEEEERYGRKRRIEELERNLKSISFIEMSSVEEREAMREELAELKDAQKTV